VKPPALVLAAGHGSRLAGFVDVPKPLAPFRGRRLIEWNLLWLAASGIRDVWVNLHHRPEAFRAVLGGGEAYGVRLRYSEEPKLLGTAGAWRRLRSHLRGVSLVVYGDNVMRFDLDRLLAAHATHAAAGALCTAALFDRHTHAHTGIAGGRVELAATGRVRRFRERDPSARNGLVNAGVYVVEPRLTDWIGEGAPDFGCDVFPRLAAARALYGHVIEADGFCLGLDTPECFAVADGLAVEGRVRL
jgi:mannose-1-phosphate guanylyltransferase